MVPTVRPAVVIADAALPRRTNDVRHGDLRRTGRDDERDSAANSYLRRRDGFWLITDPDATVVLDAVVIVPRTRPALVIAVVARLLRQADNVRHSNLRLA